MQRSTATFLLLAALFAAGVLVSWRALAEDPPAPAGPAASVEAAPIAREQDPPPGPAASVPRVRVEVRSREVFVPSPPARVQATRGLDGVELPTAVLAGVGAGSEPGRLQSGLALAVVELEGGVRLVRQVAVPEAEAARPVIGPRIVTHGRVADAAGAPIVGARVWLGEIGADGGWRQALTDGEGAFELDTPAGEGAPLVVQAAGRASAWRVVAVAPPSPDFRVVLQPASTLEVRLAAAAEDLGRARCFVVPPAAVSTELAQYPFFLQALTGGLSVDGNGGFVVTDLPTSGAVGFLVQHPRLVGGDPQVAMLQPQGARAIVPLPLSAKVWTGRVVDEAGVPVADAGVWSRPPGRDLSGIGLGRFLPPYLGVRGCHCGRSDAAGEFAIGGLDAPDAVLSVRAPGFAGRDLQWSLVDQGQPIALARWRPGPVEFRLLPPAPAIAWRAESDLAGGIQAAIGPDQPWVVSLPHAGRFRVVVTTFVGDDVRGTTTLEDVQATGPFDLQAPRLP